MIGPAENQNQERTFVALAIISDFQCTVFYTSMFMMRFVIVLNEYE